MGVSYKKLFKLLIDRDMKKKDLQQATGLSSSSITKLAKDEYVSLEVMYNRDNFRDIYSEKPKGMTRSEYEAEMGINVNENYNHYMSARAKRFLRDFNDNYRGGISEVTSGPDSDGPAIHMHHIFPEAQYPEISFYLENIIALTPTQHLAYAHPMGNTQVVSSEYQQICLLAKSSTIEENLGGEEEYVIYEFVRLLFVLDTGFSTEEFF